MRSGILLDLMQCEDVDLSHLQLYSRNVIAESKFKDIAISVHECQMAESLICQAK